MSKQSDILQKQMEDLAVISAQLDDNKELQSQIDRRIATLGRTKAVLQAREEQAEALVAAKLKSAARVATISDKIGKDVPERAQFKSVLENMSDNCDGAEKCGKCMLCRYEYLEGKGGFTLEQIKLVLGL